MLMLRLFLIILLSITSGATYAAPAQSRNCSATTGPGPTPLAMVVSGGVSLGSYEAGYLYYLTELFKLNPGHFDPKIMTGTSAGSINALISVLSLCSAAVDNPQRSLFWDAWIDVGFRELSTAAHDVTSLSLFSRDVLRRAAAKLEARWREGLAASCDMVLGISTTRRDPLRVEISKRFDVVRQEEKFVLRIKGQGDKRLPLVSNYIDQTTRLPQPLLYLPDDNKKTFSAIKSLLFASSAFPVAFSPQRLDHCLAAGAPISCRGAAVRHDFFIDGGVFDNQPLRLAYRMASTGLVENCPGQLSWNESPKKGQMPSKMLLAYLNVDSKAYPDYVQPLAETPQDSLSILFSQILGGFVSTARSKELYTLIESDPAIRQRIHHSQNYYPRMADHLRAFFGFFERDFRVFDFYQGMYDARRDVTSKLAGNSGPARQPLSFILPEAQHEGYWHEKSLPKKRLESRRAWAPFFCMRSVYDRRTEWRAACAREDLANFRILLQTSLDRLYSRCLEAAHQGTAGEWEGHDDCRNAAAKQRPPKVLAIAPELEQSWRKSSEESDLQHTMRLLANYQFHFHDLQLTPPEADRGLTEIQSKLLATSTNFAERQPFAERMFLKFTGKPLANLLQYMPTESLVYVTFGRAIEAGISTAYPRLSLVPSWVRTNMGLQIQGLHTLLSSLPNVMAITPAAGLEFDLTPISDATLQWRTGLRYGYQFSANDNFGRKNCSEDENDLKDPVKCSRAVIQPLISLSFWERVRFMLVFELYPTAPHDSARPWNALFEAGLQL